MAMIDYACPIFMLTTVVLILAVFVMTLFAVFKDTNPWPKYHALNVPLVGIIVGLALSLSLMCKK